MTRQTIALVDDDRNILTSVAMALEAEATVTSPAPARRAPRPVMAAAPVLPREPATIRACPKVPLCPPRCRGASSGANIDGSSSENHASSYSEGGLPMAPTMSSPACSQLGANTWAGLGAVKVTV